MRKVVNGAILFYDDPPPAMLEQRVSFEGIALSDDCNAGRSWQVGTGLAMRILLWSEGFWPYIGGVEVLLAQVALALRERNCAVIVVTPQAALDLPSETQYKGVPVYRFPFWTALADANIDQLMEVRQRVAKLKRAFAPDVVHMHIVGPSAFFYFQTADVHRAPLLVTLHGGGPNKDLGQDTLVGQILRRADWVTACSAALLAEARHLVPQVTPRSSVIHNGLDVPLLNPEPLPSDTPRLLCLGRLINDKGFDLALTAFASLRGRFPHARLVIAGDGAARPALEKQAIELGLKEFVHFAGWVAPEMVPALINTATVVVMPSRWEEPFGLVALEAALMARPIVATDVGGLQEVVVHQQTGLLVEKEDSGALAEAIAMLLEQPESAIRMGQTARHRAQKLFSLERCVDAYVGLYRKLVQEAAHADAAESPAPQ